MDSVLDRIRLLVAHDAWANRQFLAALLGEAPPPEAVRGLAHVVAVRHLWLDRIENRAPMAPVWPRWTVAEIERELDHSDRSWTVALEALSEDCLHRSIAYTNSQGVPWTSQVVDVLTHVPLHGAHHRGQVAAWLRAAGLEPPLVDFVHARRTGTL